MVSVGEQTGKIGDSLFKLSKYFETEAEAAVRTLTTMIEPLIMVVLGLGVGFLVMAVLLPIYSLTAKF
jgi:type IV pilus assembly protein PilC